MSSVRAFLLDLAAERPEVVLVGDLGEGWDFATLNRAFHQLMGGAAQRRRRPPVGCARVLRRGGTARSGVGARGRVVAGVPRAPAVGRHARRPPSPAAPPLLAPAVRSRFPIHDRRAPTRV